MAAATGWTSELGYATLGDITGATEDWNYFAQGTFGYTPEARGHELPRQLRRQRDRRVRRQQGSGGRRRLRGVHGAPASRRPNPAGHSIITGTAPAGRVLRLRKQFTTATSQAGVVVPDTLDTTLTVPAVGPLHVAREPVQAAAVRLVRRGAGR